MKTKIINIIVLLVLNLSCFAQLELLTDGKVNIGSVTESYSSLNVSNSSYAAIWATQNSTTQYLYGIVSKVAGANQYSFAAFYAGTTPVFHVLSNGNVYSNGIQLTSDKRFKKNIKNITDNKLLQLKAVSYFSDNTIYKNRYYNQLLSENVNAASALTKADSVWKDDNTIHYGFLAQDVQKIFPTLVNTDEEGYLSLDYISFIPMLVSKVQEQTAILNQQNNDIIELNAIITSLENNLELYIKK